MQTAIYMCLSTGCRVADLEYLRRNQISIDINGPWDEGPQRPDTNFRGLPRMVVNWRVTKNRKKPDQVGQTHVPLIWSTAPPDAVLADINEGDGEERIFSSLTTNQFNNTLRLATAALNLPVRPTSYTFRRRLLNEVDNYAQGDDEISARVSGHLDPKSMRYYKFGPKP
jgi:integrase